MDAGVVEREVEAASVGHVGGKRRAVVPAGRTDARAEAAVDADLVDRIFEFLLAEVPEVAALPVERLDVMRTEVRAEFCGERCYIAGNPQTARQQRVARILAMFNGRNATEVARKLGVSRATVYRVIKQPRLPVANSGSNEWTDYGG